ncbi:hypothetical protein [Nostoc sp.]|uniref:hypothetical protein n=1 Tax=Nostoc sp. TaxID=1180 RepID=UPI002FF7A3A8
MGKSQGTQPDSSSIQLANDPIFHLEIHQDLWADKFNLKPDKEQQFEAFIKQLWDVGKPWAEFVLGTIYQFLYDNGGTVRELLKPLQLTPKEEALWERTLPSSTAFKLGRTLGGGAAIVQGIVEFLTGSVAEAGGGGLCLTGIACPGGVVAIAAGTILQVHGGSTAIFSAGEEGKLLRDLLSPNRMESSINGSEELAKELGVSSGEIERALDVIPPGKIRQLYRELDPELFEQLLGKDEKVIHDVSRELDLVGDNTAAIDGIETTLRSKKINAQELKNVFSELVKFSERFQGRVSGEFAYRFGRANASELDTIGAGGEIKTAEDLLEGRTPLGSIRELDGIPENITPKGEAIQEYTTPDFLVTEANGVTRLAEVKTPTGSVSKNNIDGNLRDAISSIKGSNKNPTEKAYIRLDYRQAAPTNWTGDEIVRAVNGRMVRVDKTTGIKGTDVVEFVEFLYKDTAGQAQKLVLQVQNGKLVILP